MEVKEILLVDEQAPVIAAMGSILGGNGYLAMLSPDPRTASEEVGNYQFDLVVISPPGDEAGKLELLRRIKKRSPGPKVMVVGNPLELAWPVDFFGVEADDYLFTPFTAAQLCRRVARCLQDGRASAGQELLRARQELVNERVLTALGHKIRDIHNSLFDLQSQIKSLGDHDPGRIVELADDLNMAMGITEEFLSHFLARRNEMTLA